MDSLLNFRPEPFPELDHDGGSGAFAGQGEEEVRPRGKRSMAMRKGAQAWGKTSGRRFGALGSLFAGGADRRRPRRPVVVAAVGSIPFIPLRDDATPKRPGGEGAGSEGSGSAVVSEPSADPGSERVRWVQDSLNRALDLDLVVDGVMGRQTRSALRLFQRRSGLPVTGLAGPDTEEALRATCLSGNRRRTTALPPMAELDEFYELDPESDSAWLGEIDSERNRIRRAQQALNRILDLRLVPDGMAGPQTRSALRSFQSRQGLVADGRLSPETEKALQVGLTRSPVREPEPQSPPIESLEGRTLDWRWISDTTRMAYVMARLVEHYGFPEAGAAGLVGNFSAESGCIPNRIEGSSVRSPMTATDFSGRLRSFTAQEIMSRDKALGIGPALAGVGLAQWTSLGRRAGLFRHRYQGQEPGANILFNMDAQIDYAVNELHRAYSKVIKLLLDPRVTLDAACDEVTYGFEGPAAVHEVNPATGKIVRRLPRTHPQVQTEFRRRREFAWLALRAYWQTLV